ncbi:MAG: peptide ABC transporter substrate-binding protein [Candidatus Falkowbacteria bacterium]
MNSSNSKIIIFFNKAKRALKYFYFRRIKTLFAKRSSNEINNEQAQSDLDKKLVFSLSKSRIPSFGQLKYIKKFLSPKELLLMRASIFIIIASIVFSGIGFYFNNLKVVPNTGGEYIEGLIGSPKYINPLYSSISDVDSDISSLIFSSLFKRGKYGELVKDLVEEYEINADSKIFTFKIKKNVEWHNGGKLTVDDILFTFNMIKDKQYQSTLRPSFIGVELEKVDESTIKFILIEPYAAFLDLLTFGILPQELWQEIPADTASLAGFNLKPAGSGPYKFKSLVKDEKTGIVRFYNLIINENYYGEKPFIEKITFKFFPSFEEVAVALNDGTIDGVSYLPRNIRDGLAAKDSLNFHSLNLPQLSAIFFNEKNNTAIKDKKVRQALLFAIDKNKIVEDILGGEARIINGPILPDSFAYNPESKKYEYNIEESAKLLDASGWKIKELTEDDITEAKKNILLNEENEEQDADDIKKAEVKVNIGAGEWRAKGDEFLNIKLVAVNNEESEQIAEIIKNSWQALNINVIVELIQASEIQAYSIKSRNFDALLYSEIIGADPDPYAFWHSTQIGENGLNITDYSNKDVDILLEEARLTSDIETRKEKYYKFQEIISEDVPAIFMYSPTYTYIQPKSIKGFGVKNILIPRDRFSNIAEWYIKTKKELNF